MAVKKRITPKDWDLLPDPVWTEAGGSIQPTPFFFQWWRMVAEKKFGDGSRWLDAAVELGYVSRFTDPNTGGVCYDPIGFRYDPNLLRDSLAISRDMPLVSHNGRPDNWRRLWDHLMGVDRDG